MMRMVYDIYDQRPAVAAPPPNGMVPKLERWHCSVGGDNPLLFTAYRSREGHQRAPRLGHQAGTSSATEARSDSEKQFYKIKVRTPIR